ncbi:hypothetical protein RRG08_048330 [Elysia crispata]|uniref:Uncharacterized protein n=1 Tax=Elysia crispata TaxID=231223 RepID=A0AAE0XUH4_9GAST|nr:hypothetical protein RRG08_048330 [Elysia crispata]
MGENGRKGLQTVTMWAHMACCLSLPKSHIRVQTFTKDTAEALAWTCKCLVELCNHLPHSLASNRHHHHSASAGTGSRPPSPSFQTFSHLNHVIPMAATQRAAIILMKRFCLQTDQEGNSKYNKKITKLV